MALDLIFPCGRFRGRVASTRSPLVRDAIEGIPCGRGRGGAVHVSAAASQDCARRFLGDAAPWSMMKCLTLLASAGDLPAWNSRHTSVGHQAIPLASPEMLHRLPMISQLVQQFGLEPNLLLARSPGLL